MKPIKHLLALPLILLASCSSGSSDVYRSRAEAKAASDKYGLEGEKFVYQYKSFEEVVVEMTEDEIRQAKQPFLNKRQDCMSRRPLYETEEQKSWECTPDELYLFDTTKTKNQWVDKEGYKSSRNCFEEEQTKQFVCADALKPSQVNEDSSLRYDQNYRYFNY